MNLNAWNLHTIVGAVLTYTVVVALLADAAMQFVKPAPLRAAMRETGFEMSAAPRLGVIMLVCALALAIPSTAVIGAILTTGFLGGAIATHVRIGEYAAKPQIVSALLGVAAWAGVYLSNPSLRTVLPLAS